eukprot:9485261-Pyramimonas_sp.AAC.1
MVSKRVERSKWPLLCLFNRLPLFRLTPIVPLSLPIPHPSRLAPRPPTPTGGLYFDCSATDADATFVAGAAWTAVAATGLREGWGVGEGEWGASSGGGGVPCHQKPCWQS